MRVVIHSERKRERERENAFTTTCVYLRVDRVRVCSVRVLKSPLHYQTVVASREDSAATWSKPDGMYSRGVTKIQSRRTCVYAHTCTETDSCGRVVCQT